MASIFVGASLWGARITYVACATIFAFIGIRAILGTQPILGGLMCLAALYLALGVLRGRNLSAVPEIPLASIQKVEAHWPRPPLTRGYFIVHFTESQKPRQRIIMLPGSLSKGGAEFEKAIRVLTASGLLKA